MTTISEEMQLLSFNIILHAGNARSYAMEAIQEAKMYNFDSAYNKIELADEEFAKAHHEQTGLLQGEAEGNKHDISVILIHAQDHLMTAMTVKELANEMIEMYERIKKVGEK